MTGMGFVVDDKGAILTNIPVGNFGPNVNELDIRPLFEKHGAVQRFQNDD